MFFVLNLNHKWKSEHLKGGFLGIQTLSERGYQIINKTKVEKLNSGRGKVQACSMWDMGTSGVER